MTIERGIEQIKTVLCLRFEILQCCWKHGAIFHFNKFPITSTELKRQIRSHNHHLYWLEKDMQGQEEARARARRDIASMVKESGERQKI